MKKKKQLPDSCTGYKTTHTHSKFPQALSMVLSVCVWTSHSDKGKQAHYKQYSHVNIAQ